MVAMLLKDTMCYGDEWEEGCFNSDQFRNHDPASATRLRRTRFV